MTTDWPAVAQRVADALSLQPGMLVQVGERSGRPEVLAEILLALEERGATPLIEHLPAEYLERLLATTAPTFLANWDQHRRGWLEKADRLLVLGGDHADFDSTPPAALSAWRQATERMIRIEEDRLLPFVLVAIPTAARAERLGMTLAELEAIVLPAVAASPEALQREIDRVLPQLRDANRITIGNPDGSTLELDRTGRHWHSDTGVVPATSEIQPVINLPAGSVYTTVVEESARGRLHLPRAGTARDVTLSFEAGRIVAIEASAGADGLAEMFDQHSGEPRRISHIGIGLNPKLHTEVDWPLVDEHRHGSLFIAFGDNRYLGGQNASSLNIDFVTPNASLCAEKRFIVDAGRVPG